jgi:hypothetical protein
VGAARRATRLIRDWGPVALIGGAYVVLHQLGSTFARLAHVEPQLGFDTWIGGGTPPTVRLQHLLWHSGHPRWWDYATSATYLSHFVVTLTVAIVLWRIDYPLFRRLRALILTVTFAGFATYLAYPAIPPWLASARGDMPHATRIVRAVWQHLGSADLAAVFSTKSHYAFPVGALPSLHAAWPFMLMLLLWTRAGRWRALLVTYTLAMAFTLVYTADHFVFDIAMGWVYSTFTFVAVDRVLGDVRRPRAHAPRRISCR